MIYGLIGGRLGHSFSRGIHAKIADYPYTLRELAEAELEDFLRRREFEAINVTIPYKQAVIPYLDCIDDAARRIGAVNTIVKRGGKLFLGCVVVNENALDAHFLQRCAEKVDCAAVN